MTSYNKNFTPSTAVSLSAALFASTLLASPMPEFVGPHEITEFVAQGTGYKNWGFTSSTYSAAHFENAEFEKTVAKFYDDLYSSQEALGKEFSKVLFDNLWDLYVD